MFQFQFSLFQFQFIYSAVNGLGNAISFDIFWKLTMKLTVTCNDSVASLAQLILSWP